MQSAAIAAASSGVNTLVTGKSGMAIRVIAFGLSFSGTVNAKFQTSTGPTDLSGLFYGVADTTFAGQPMPYQHPGGMGFYFETGVGDDLDLNLSGATAVGGYVVYQFVKK